MNKNDLSLLLARGRISVPGILSVYLSLAHDAVSAKRAYVKALKQMAAATRRTIAESAEREKFDAAVRHVEGFLSEYSPAAKSMALFFDTSDGFFWHQELDARLGDQMRWDHEAFVWPLFNALDELEMYAVILADRANLRVFTVALGRIEEVFCERLDTRRVRRLKTAGHDHLGSTNVLQRKADSQIQANLRRVVQKMEELADYRNIHRFVLAGTAAITSAVRRLLPPPLSTKVIGETALALTATPTRIHAITSVIAEQFERDTEIEKVNNVVTTAARRGNAVVGVENTLHAVNAGHVFELIYASGLSYPGYECGKCRGLFITRNTRCPLCASRLLPVRDVIERAAAHTLQARGKIEVVAGDASAALIKAGGIGALLKVSEEPFRPYSGRAKSPARQSGVRAAAPSQAIETI